MEVELTNGYRFEMTGDDYAEFKGIEKNIVWHCGKKIEYFSARGYELRFKISGHSVENFDMLLKHRIRSVDEVSFPVFELASHEWHDDCYVIYNSNGFGSNDEYFWPRKEVRKLPYGFDGRSLTGCPPDDMCKTDSAPDTKFLRKLFPEKFETERMVCDHERKHYAKRAVC